MTTSAAASRSAGARPSSGPTGTTTAAAIPARPTSSRTPDPAGRRLPSSRPPTARRATTSATASRSAATRRSSGPTRTTTAAAIPARPTSSRTRFRLDAGRQAHGLRRRGERLLRLQRRDQRTARRSSGRTRTTTAAAIPARPTSSRTRDPAGRRSPSSPPPTARRATTSAAASRSAGARPSSGRTATTTAAAIPARPTSSRTPAPAGRRSPSSPPPTARRTTTSATASRSAGPRPIVGAYRDDDRGSNSGSAYVFENTGSGWTQVAKLTASDGAANDYFGYSVAISGDTAIVGAYRDDDRGSDSGSAYLFTLLPAVDLQAASDTGASDADNVTSDTTPTFDVIATPYFRVLCDGVLISGDFETGESYTAPELPDGTYDYTVVAVDAAGNESSPSVTLTVTIDTTRPGRRGRVRQRHRVDGRLPGLPGRRRARAARRGAVGVLRAGGRRATRDAALGEHRHDHRCL